MNATEYFRRAREESGFRRQQLEDLRYYKNVTLGCLAILAVLGTYQIIASCADWRGWRSVLTIISDLLMVGVCGLTHRSKVKTIAALKAMDAKLDK
jgi:hypothetical protein